MTVIKIYSRDLDGWLMLEETAIVPTKDVESLRERAKVFGYVTRVTKVDSDT